jgi:hypothetical protein
MREEETKLATKERNSNSISGISVGIWTYFLGVSISEKGFFVSFFVTSISREHTIIVINRYHSAIRDFRGISPHGLDVERVSGREESWSGLG